MLQVFDKTLNNKRNNNFSTKIYGTNDLKNKNKTVLMKQH